MTPIEKNRKESRHTTAVIGILLGLIGAVSYSAAPYANVFIPATCEGTTPCFGGEGVSTPSIPGIVDANYTVTDFIFQIIAFLLDFVLVLAILMIIIAGMYLIFSNGDEGNKEKAKKIVIYTIVGVILVLFARAIVIYVDNFFTV